MDTNNTLWHDRIDIDGNDRPKMTKKVAICIIYLILEIVGFFRLIKSGTKIKLPNLESNIPGL